MGTYRSYVTGFIASLILTLSAFYVVWQHISNHHQAFSNSFLIVVIIGLALIQLFVQLTFFLHLGRDRKSRWNLIIFLFMVMVVVMVVGGSLWIMRNLDYHMKPHDAETYIIKDEGLSSH